MATDELDVGANIDLLETTQGRVYPVVFPHATTTSGATVSYRAPDSEACTVEYGTSPVWGTGAREPDGGGDRERNVELTGLNSETLYYYRVLCAVEQLSGDFKTD